MWPSWRKYVTVGADLEVSYAQDMPRVADSLLLPVDQNVERSTPSPTPCLLECH